MMLDFFLGNYAYIFLMALFVIGLYGVVTKRNLVKKLIGLNIFQSAIILVYVAGASKWGATVPILESTETAHGAAEAAAEAAHAATRAAGGAIEAANYINPLPHTLMLTAMQDLGLGDKEPTPSAELRRGDKMRVLCPKCRQVTSLLA